MKFKIEPKDKHFILKEADSAKFYTDIVNEDTPCDGCVHVSNCGAKRLACDAFALYVNNGTVNWSIPRKPTRRTYSQTMRMGNGDSSLIRNINKKLRERASA